MTARPPSEEVIDRVAELLRLHGGLRQESNLRARLRRCIRDDAASLGKGFDGYLRSLSAGGGELQSLFNHITVQESGFFRHPEHFKVLAADILPGLPPPIRIWSAGCANGQEAFSLAMLLEEHGIDGSVIGTDVSTDALQRARTARYTAREVTGLTSSQIARHLVPAGQTWEVNRSLRNRVITLHHNLVNALPDQVRSAQVVFCRNVLIYLTPQHARSFLENMAHALPGAWLFLGSSETVWSLGDRYETVRIEDTYAYRPRGVGVPTATAEPRVTTAPARPPRSPSVAPPAADIVAPVADSAAHPTTAHTATHRTAPELAAPPATAADSTTIARLLAEGQRALEVNDVRAAVVTFRQWVYLAQDDALAHLHLALALEADGDLRSAQRAFGAARRALQSADPRLVENAIDGYATSELLKLLDAKQQGPTG